MRPRRPTGARPVARRRGARRRIVALEAYANSAELAGDLAEAVKAWRELSAVRGEAVTPGLGRGAAPACRGPRPAGATASAASPRGGRPPRPSPPAAGPAEPRSSASRWPTTSAPAPSYSRGDRARRAAAKRRARASASTCGRARSAWRASRGRSAATTRTGSRPCATAWRWRSSTTSAGRRGALPAPQHGALRLRRLPPGRGRSTTALELCRTDGDAEHRGRLRHLHGLRPARVRRVAARPLRMAAS